MIFASSSVKTPKPTVTSSREPHHHSIHQSIYLTNTRTASTVQITHNVISPPLANVSRARFETSSSSRGIVSSHLTCNYDDANPLCKVTTISGMFINSGPTHTHTERSAVGIIQVSPSRALARIYAALSRITAGYIQWRIHIRESRAISGQNGRP